MQTSTRALNRRAAIIHPTVALALATLMGLLATLPDHLTLPTPAVTVATPDTWMVAVAVATTLVLAGLVVRMARKASR